MGSSDESLDDPHHGPLHGGQRRVVDEAAQLAVLGGFPVQLDPGAALVFSMGAAGLPAEKVFQRRWRHATSDGHNLTWLLAPTVSATPCEALQDMAGVLHPLRDYEQFPVGFADEADKAGKT